MVGCDAVGSLDMSVMRGVTSIGEGGGAKGVVHGWEARARVGFLMCPVKALPVLTNPLARWLLHKCRLHSKCARGR